MYAKKKLHDFNVQDTSTGTLYAELTCNAQNSGQDSSTKITLVCSGITLH